MKAPRSWLFLPVNASVFIFVFQIQQWLFRALFLALRFATFASCTTLLFWNVLKLSTDGEIFWKYVLLAFVKTKTGETKTVERRRTPIVLGSADDDSDRRRRQDIFQSNPAPPLRLSNVDRKRYFGEPNSDHHTMTKKKVKRSNACIKNNLGRSAYASRMPLQSLVLHKQQPTHAEIMSWWRRWGKTKEQFENDPHKNKSQNNHKQSKPGPPKNEWKWPRRWPQMQCPSRYPQKKMTVVPCSAQEKVSPRIKCTRQPACSDKVFFWLTFLEKKSYPGCRFPEMSPL